MKNKNIRVSVAMATYNGEMYIEEQIKSILSNLTIEDELIISDDGSKDKTIEITKEYIEKDNRIKLIEGPQKGIKQNFANAISKCNGKYIFLADQDDIWMKDKVEKVLKQFEEKNSTLIIHDAKIINEKEEEVMSSFFEYRNSGKGIIKNIYKNTYIGCCIAFDSKIKEKVLPIPDNIEMHDQWIGIIAEQNGESYFLKEPLILYRRHSENNSSMKHYGIIKMIRNRITLIKELIRKK